MGNALEAPLPDAKPAAARPLAVVYRRIGALKFDSRNPRVHSPHQIRQIGRSIQAFGFNVPILVDAELNIVAGHGRAMACQALGWT